MKVNFAQPITDFDGEQLVTDDGVPLTLGVVSAMALNRTQADRELESLDRGELCLKVYRAGELEIKLEEATLIRRDLPWAWAPMIVAQAHHMLDPGDEKPKQQPKKRPARK